jgi:predicted nucleic acid-binding protein
MYEAILDDQAARRCAAALGIRLRGTLGILLLAKKAGRLSRVRPLLEQLIAHGFRIDTGLLQAALQLVGE